MPRMQRVSDQVDFELRVVKAFKEKMEPFQALLHLKDEEEQKKATTKGQMLFYGTVALIASDQDFDLRSGQGLDKYTEAGIKAHAKKSQVCQLAAAKLDGKIDAEILFDFRINDAAEIFSRSACESADVEAFKKACTHAVDTYALAFRAHGTSELVDQVKAVGMAVLGVLVAFITSPAFLVPQSIHDHGLWIKSFNFFAGPETDKSKAVEKEVDDAFVSNLLP